MKLKNFCKASHERLLISIERLDGTEFSFYYYWFEENDLHGYDNAVVSTFAFYDEDTIIVWCYEARKKKNVSCAKKV